MAELQVADVRQQVSLSLFTDFEDFKVFKPNEEVHLPALNTMLDQLIAWSAALKRVRQEAAASDRSHPEGRLCSTGGRWG